MKFLPSHNLFLKRQTYIIYLLGSIASAVILLFGLSVGIYFSRVLMDNVDFTTLKTALSLKDFISGGDLFSLIVISLIYYNLLGILRLKGRVTSYQLGWRHLLSFVIAVISYEFLLPHLPTIEVTSNVTQLLLIPFAFGIVLNLQSLTPKTANDDVFEDLIRIAIISIISGLFSIGLIYFLHGFAQPLSLALLGLFIFFDFFAICVIHLIYKSIIRSSLQEKTL